MTKKTEEKEPALPAVAPPSAIAAPRGGRGLEDDDGGQVQVPLVTIAQAAGTKRPAHVNPGRWYAPEAGKDLGDKVILVPIALFPTRAMFMTKESARPECTSLDAKVPLGGESPVADDGKTIYHDCERCDFGQWHKDRANPKGNGVPPRCQHALNFVGFVVADDGKDIRFGRIRFKSTSHRIGESIRNNTKTAFPPRDLWDVAIELGTQVATRGGQKWHVATQREAGATKLLYPDLFAECERYYQAWEQMKGRVVRESMSDLVDVEEGESGEGAAAPVGGPLPGEDDSLPF